MNHDDLAAAQKGDADAFLRLLQHYDRQLMSVIYRFSGDFFDRQDLYQDIFVHAFQSVAKFRGEASFSSWLYRIALNRCIDFMRRNKPVEELEETQAMTDAAPLEQRSKLRAIHRALAKIKGPQRICFHLHYIEDWDVNRIAETMSMSHGTVKSHLNRARVKIKKSKEVGPWLAAVT